MSIPSDPSNIPPIHPNPTPSSNTPNKPITTPSTPTTPTFKPTPFKPPTSSAPPPSPHQVGSSPIETQSSHLQSPMASGPWAAMFPGGATPQQLTQFINNFLKSMIYEMKRSDQQWKQAQDEMKKVAEGDDPDE